MGCWRGRKIVALVQLRLSTECEWRILIAGLRHMGAKKSSQMESLTTYRFCPICGREFSKEGVHEHKFVCPSSHSFYRPFKPCVVGIISAGDQILLTRRSIRPFRGYWDIPGGFLIAGEHPEVGLARELREELGLEVVVDRFLGFYVDKYDSRQGADFVLNLFFLVVPVGDAVPQISSDEVSDIRWFANTDLPEQLAFESNRRALRDWLKVYNRQRVERIHSDD